MVNALLIALGVGLLYAGGEALVKGATRLARQLGLSSLVIGLTVVAFGTSAPELAATLVAVFTGAAELALGNVLGSNIANVGLILGVAALMRPLHAESTLLWREVPFMVGVGFLLIPLSWNGIYGRPDGGLLLSLFVFYLWVLLRKGEVPTVADDDEPAPAKGRLWGHVGLVVLGLVLLLLGAQVLVTGAVGLARSLGVSESLIGLTLVAFGTSLPELAASIIAALHDEGDLVLGNVIGSNIFNVLLVLGTASLVHGVPVDPAAFERDMWVALGFSFAIVPLLLLWRQRRLHLLEGVVLLLGYLTYIVVVVR